LHTFENKETLKQSIISTKTTSKPTH